MAGPSFDCLLSVTDASISQWLLLSCAPPLVLWFVSVIYMMWRSIRTERASMEISQVMKDALKVSIVVTNCFLPDMVAALVRFFPCIHFQSGAASSKFLQFQVETQCDKVLWMRVGSILAASILGIVLGPLYWVAVIKKSVKWKDRKEVLGFLTSGYKEDAPSIAICGGVPKWSFFFGVLFVTLFFCFCFCLCCFCFCLGCFCFCVCFCCFCFYYCFCFCFCFCLCFCFCFCCFCFCFCCFLLI